MDIKAKFIDKVFDAIIKRIVEVITFSSISVITIIAYIRGVLQYSFKIQIWHCIVIIAIISLFFFIVRSIKLKLKAKQKFLVGTKVILTTDTYPIMSAGKYNYLNNKVKCTWFVDKSVKHDNINQDILKEYVANINKSTHKSSYWDK